MKSNLIQAFLFLKGKSGAELKEISSVLKIKPNQIKEEVELINKELIERNSPLIIKRSDTRFKMTVAKQTALDLANVLDSTINIKLSKAVLETLTIIAYKQPTTRPAIEQIRGVSADYAIRKLLDFELIEDMGRSDDPGQPHLYQTTHQFLDLFDISSLNELPDYGTDLDDAISPIVQEIIEKDGK